jgi:hypothetical protein
MSIEWISDNTCTVAIVIKQDFQKDGLNFISKPDFPLQLGINRYVKGSVIKSHYHINREIIVKTLQEIILIKNGSVLVKLYDSKNVLFKSLTLTQGDLIFFISGGHGFEVLEDTTIIEVKQGPYSGKSLDKVTIE